MANKAAPKKGYVSTPTIFQNEKNLDQLNSLLGVLSELDDKSLVLAIAAFAEDTLGGVLVQYMRDHKQARELVEGFSAPLGTFSARCKAALAFGLISNQQYHNLDILRNIRNAIAHNWTGVSLDRDDIRSRINNLKITEGVASILGVASETDRLRSVFTLLLTELRLLQKELELNNTRAPLIALQMGAPVHVEFEVVDELAPPSARKTMATEPTSKSPPSGSSRSEGLSTDAL